ncbi:CheR family methyltransferase [Natrialbaceae archaeon A-gly3]
MTDDSFAELLEYIEDELSFATSHYNDSYLDRRISSRMRRTGSDSYEEYFETLRESPKEQEALLDSMSINVTGFFRNPDVWDGVRGVLRELSEEQDTVHVWSAPCADGREPYSLSMLAHDDRQIDESSVEILATDISESALETARHGVYVESRTTNISEELDFLSNYDRYIDQDEKRFRVREKVKHNVTFEQHDLINDPSKSGFDLVICRNLFIYIDSEYKKSMLETILGSLRPNGYLIIGKAETIPPSLKSAFPVHDGHLRIYQRDDAEL